jgi:hypothetical protein
MSCGVPTAISRCGSTTGSGRIRSACAIENIAAFAPMPSASVATATTANEGVRRICRIP